MLSGTIGFVEIVFYTTFSKPALTPLYSSENSMMRHLIEGVFLLSSHETNLRGGIRETCRKHSDNFTPLHP